MRRSSLRTVIVVLLVAVLGTAVVLVATGSGAGTPTTQEREARRDARQQIARLDVPVSDQGGCERTSAREYRCELEAENGATVTMVVRRDANGEPTYETVAGLIDGTATARQLEVQLGSRLGEQVAVECPAVIAGNEGATFTCRARGSDQAEHRLRVKVLNDRTGDVTFSVLD